MLIDIAGVGLINVARTGPQGAQPLVLLHPVGLDLTWWGDQFAAFGVDYDIIALDMPGHGLSAKLDGLPSFQRLAGMVEEVIAALQIGPVHLVGLSIGGMIAQTVALRRPELLRSLSLLGTLCTFPPEVRTALRERARIARSDGMPRIAELTNQRWFPEHFRNRRPDMLDRVTGTLLGQDRESYAAIWEMIADLELHSEIHKISCPTLVLTGEADVNAPPAVAKVISDAIDGAVMQVMPGVGHLPPFEAPEAFNAILRTFLSNAGK